MQTPQWLSRWCSSSHRSAIVIHEADIRAISYNFVEIDVGRGQVDQDRLHELY